MSPTWYRRSNYFLQTCFTISTSLFLILIPLHWFKQPCFTLQVYSISFCPYTATFKSHVFSDPTSFPQTFCWLVSLFILPSQILTSVSILLSFPPVCSSPFLLPSHYTLVFEPSIILFHVPSKVSGRPLLNQNQFIFYS